MVHKKIKIQWMPYADNDLHEIALYLSQDSEEQAERVVKIISREPIRLCVFPELGQIVTEIGQENIREIHCFSWRIIYRYKSDEHLIQILTVFHSARELNETIVREILEEEEFDE